MTITEKQDIDKYKEEPVKLKGKPMKNSKFVGLLIAMIIITVALTLLISFPFVSEYYFIKGLKIGRDLGLEVGIKRGMKIQQLAFETTLSRLKERKKNNPTNNVIEKIPNTTNGQIKD